ncbi:MAG: FMN-binding protein [Melioribacteraceae bacterium]|nr:MAG: FMN-binding protein [Melioribacteraceae bacterium]
MKTVIKMLITLSLIGVVSGGLLSEISKWAEPKIEMHRKAATEQAIFLVQPDAKSYNKIENLDFELYEVLDENNNRIGFALPYEGNGFQGKIRLMFGIKSDLKELVGLEVLEQVETPGLGTKITEEPFTSQFVNLIAEPKIEWVKGVAPSSDNEIQAITGATISSKALVEIINAGLTKLRSVENGGNL